MLHDCCHMWFTILFASTHHYQSPSTQLLAIALHGMWLFPPFSSSLRLVLFYDIQFNANQHEQLGRCVWKKAASTQKSDIFNLLSDPPVRSEIPDTILLLLLLSEGGKASLLNAPVLTSIMTVSRIEKPSRQISFSTQWWLTASVEWILMPHTQNCSKLLQVWVQHCLHIVIIFKGPLRGTRQSNICLQGALDNSKQSEIHLLRKDQKKDIRQWT